METLDLTAPAPFKPYALLKADYYIQVILFWIILGCGITVFGLYFSAILMLPWAAVQLISALYNSVDKWQHEVYRRYYIIYWSLVATVAVLFIAASNLKYDQRHTLIIGGMVLSACTGCYHTYIIHTIYKKLK